jgi:hypothetical protein
MRHIIDKYPLPVDQRLKPLTITSTEASKEPGVTGSIPHAIGINQ